MSALLRRTWAKEGGAIFGSYPQRFGVKALTLSQGIDHRPLNLIHQFWNGAVGAVKAFYWRTFGERLDPIAQRNPF